VAFEPPFNSFCAAVPGYARSVRIKTNQLLEPIARTSLFKQVRSNQSTNSEYLIRLHRCGVRYAQPRKLNTRRGQRKAEQNAWCLTCQQPMARHGKNFSCAQCHIATRIQISWAEGRNRRHPNNVRPIADNRLTYPFCLGCQVRMQRFSRTTSGKRHSYRCRQCKTITASHRDSSKAIEREGQILELLKAGYLDKQIVRKMNCHHRTVARLRKEVNSPRLCECGQLFYHVTKCHQRPGWQTVAREKRDAFDDLLVRINRRVPSMLPEEMRADICQEMLLQMMESIENVLKNVPRFIKDYKKHYPFHYQSIDSNPKLLERLAG